MGMKILPGDSRAALSKIRDTEQEFITQHVPFKHYSGNLTTRLPQAATHDRCEIVVDSDRRLASVPVLPSWRIILKELNNLKFSLCCQ